MKRTERTRRTRTKKGETIFIFACDDDNGKDHAQTDSRPSFDPFGVGKGEGIELTESKEGGQENDQKENGRRTHR